MWRVGLGGQVILLTTADSEGHSDVTVQGKDVYYGTVERGDNKFISFSLTSST